MTSLRSLIGHTSLILAGVIIAGAGTAVFAWTGPTGTAPASNASAPLNVSTASQVKNGNLSVNVFTATQNSLFYGSLGVGSSNAPSYTLDVTGTARVTGNVTAAGYFHSSDARLKQNVQTSPGLSIVEKLRGVTFDWKQDGAPSAGVIAQEVEAVLPSAVRTDARGMKTVEYDQLIAPLIQAIKEQQAQIADLQKEVAQLKQQK